MSNNGETLEVCLLNKWAVLDDNIITKALENISMCDQCPLFKGKSDFIAYIAKIVIYSLFYENDFESKIEEEPKDWAVEPHCMNTETDFYSIQMDERGKQIIIATSIKDSDNNPFYLFFSENTNDEKTQPGFFNKITNCTNHVETKPKCVTDIIKTDKIDNLEYVEERLIDWEHIFSDKDPTKGVFRFPKRFQIENNRRKLFLMIINEAIGKQKQNIKSTIRYENSVKQILCSHYLPLDFCAFGGNKHELYACVRETKMKGETTEISIPTILTFKQVYSQLLEKPKIDHWTYALCKSLEKKENRELEEK